MGKFARKVKRSRNERRVVLDAADTANWEDALWRESMVSHLRFVAEVEGYKSFRVVFASGDSEVFQVRKQS